MEAIADKLWLVDSGKVSEFGGDLNDYQDYLLRKAREFREAQQAAAAEAQGKVQGKVQGSPSQSVSSYKTKEQKQLEAQKRAALRPLKLKIEANEKKMASIEKRLATIDERMADSSLYEDSNKGELEKLILERAELNNDKETLEEEWLMLNDELEAAQGQ